MHLTRFLRRILRATALLVLVTGASACSDLAANSPLTGARRSAEALAQAGLDALVAGDRAGLEALLVDREEYEEVLWPLLPDGQYVSFDFVWGMSAPRNRKALRNILEDYTGIPMELVAVDLGEEIEEHDGLTLYREARMTVRRTDTGVEGILPLMDVVVEMGGGWKFLNYDDDI